MPTITQLRINGAQVDVSADRETSLLEVLRDELGLTGAKYGCGEGRCGACTVLVDGEPVRSCITKLRTIAGSTITTIEGLEQDGKLHPLQQAFLEAGAMQCGYCTCGMIMQGVALLRKNASPEWDDVVDFMNGNMCRCGTYPRIIAAITSAAKHMKEARR
jgi:aerobic-type carbon monoxide dehydrogenase small subunit (CoxS/CutS family)